MPLPLCDRNVKIAAPAIWAIVVVGFTIGWLEQGVGRIIATTGELQILEQPPSSFAPGGLESNSTMFVYQEQHDYQLTQSVSVIPATFGESYGGNNIPPAGTLFGGTLVDVYLIHADLLNSFLIPQSFSATLAFDRNILAVVPITSQLDASDGQFAVGGTRYPVGVSSRGIQDANDGIQIGADGRTISIGLTLSHRLLQHDPFDQIRIITASASESPAHRWVNTSIGEWNNPLNWDVGLVPDGATQVTIRASQGQAVQQLQVSGDASAGSILVAGEGNALMTLAVGAGVGISVINDLRVAAGGILELANSTVNASRLVIESGGTITGWGRIAADIMSEGTLAIDIGGTGNGQYDRLSVSGAATLDGALVLNFKDPALSVAGNSWTIVSAGSLTTDPNVLDSIVVTGLADHVYVAVETTANDVICKIRDVGDMDGDGDIDTLDAPIFASALFNPSAFSPIFDSTGHEAADMDANGRLDFDDIDDFAGMVSDAPPEAVRALIERTLTGVPEPAAIWRSAALILGAALARRTCPPSVTRRD